jgi:hypothetical protein
MGPMEKRLARKRRKGRLKKLRALLRAIQRGDVDSFKPPESDVFMPDWYSPRKQYLSPLDRSNYNYGYMEIGELMTGSDYAK